MSGSVWSRWLGIEKLRAIRRVFGQARLRRREVGALLVLSTLLAGFEGMGIGLLLPVLEYVEDPSAAPTSGIWGMLLDAADAIGVELGLVSLLIMAFIPVVLRQVFYFANMRYGAVVRMRTLNRLRVAGFSSLMKADLEHVERVGLAEAVTALQRHVNMAGAAVRVFVQLQMEGLLILLYFVLLVALSPILSAVALFATLMVSGMTRQIVRRTRELGRQTVVLGSEYGRQLQERMGAVRLAKMRGAEVEEIERFRVVAASLETVQMKQDVWRASVQVIVDPAMMLAVFAIVFFGVEVVGMTLSSLGLFLFVLLRVANQTKMFNGNRQSFAASIEGLVRIDAVTRAAEAAQRIRSGEREFTGLRDCVEFRDVAFEYRQDDSVTPVLEDVDLKLPAGSLTAIVGSSGSGKSTLVDLIPRLRERCGGQILLDGVPIEDFELTSLRRKIGFLTQEATLLDETVADNLSYALTVLPSDEAVESALARSYSTSIVEGLPKGLDTRVGERGGRLSGGERQRLSLARELLLEPDILILDEPTSALDSESESYIKASLDRLHGEKTLIVIAHRLSTVQSADQILVLEHGRIVERGTHDELVDAGGRYADLFESQIIGADSSGSPSEEAESATGVTSTTDASTGGA